MKLAVITDSSAVLSEKGRNHTDLFCLDVPVVLNGETFLEGKTISDEEFYAKMACSKDLPTTSQPSLLDLENTLSNLSEQGYTHVLGLFLSSGISGFWQNIQYLAEEFPGMTIAFPDSKITSVPLGVMVEKTLEWAGAGLDFETIVERVQVLIDGTRAFILVDDLNHLVKGGRLSNGSALLGNLLSIKPILHFTQEGTIEVYEKVRTEKKALKRLIEIVDELVSQGDYDVFVIHANAFEKAEQFAILLESQGVASNVRIDKFGAVIGTHLGSGAIAVGFCPRIR